MRALERIPLHDHRDNNSGGAIDRASVTQYVAGSQPGGTSDGTSVHAIDGPLHTGELTFDDLNGASHVITAALSNPPTQAELETAVGSPASEVAGQAWVVTDSDTGRVYGVTSDGSAFVFVPLVQTASDAVSLATGAGIFSDFAAMWAAAQYDATSNKTFWAYLNAAGDVCVRSWDHAAGTASAATVLHSALSSGDSHAQPALLVRSSDRKVIVVYCAHAGANLYVRISSAAADISAFGSETDIASSVGGTDYTYPILHELTDGIYLFLRTYTGTFGGGPAHAGAIWSYTKSTDNGATWRAAVEVCSQATYGMYAIPSKTAADRIDYSVVERSTFDTAGGSAFHMYMIGGTFYTSADVEITATKPFDETEMTQVWASDGTQRADPGQVQLGPDGKPRMLFREFETISPEDCKYRWGVYAAGWTTYEAAAAGSGSLTATAVMDDGDPYTIAYSKDVGGVAQIFRATTIDEGVTWAETQLTDSANENALLVTVRGGPADLKRLWNAKSGGWSRNDTVAADFMGGSFLPAEGGEVQRIVVLDGDAFGDGLAEAIWRRGTDGIWYVSRDLGVTWESLASGENPAVGLLTVDAGTPSYDASGDDLVVTFASDYGYDADGPYYDSTGAATGEEALLAIDPSSGELVVIPYVP